MIKQEEPAPSAPADPVQLALALAASAQRGSEEAEALNNRMMSLIMKLMHPEKDRQSRQALELLPPCRTLYINNLNEKQPLKTLEADLKALFGKFGAIKDFLALTSFWRRGQAFITFETVEAATAALEALQGTEYAGKPLRVNYARKESRLCDPARQTAAEPTAEPTAKSTAESTAKSTAESTVRKPYGIRQRESALQAEFLALQRDIQAFQSSAAAEVEDRNKRKTFSLPLAQTSESKRLKANESAENKVLFVDNLGEDVAEAELIAAFSKFNGFEKVRFIEAKRVAFVDFRAVEPAADAVAAFKDAANMRVAFAKR